MDKITQINLVLKDYFDLNKTVKIIPAKNMMPYFVLAGIFSKDEKNGLPIHYLLRKLETLNQLSNIPYAVADKKTVYTKWYFESEKCSVQDLLKIEQKMLKAKLKKAKKKVKKKTVPKKTIQSSLNLIFPKS
jgi:hypothetical protein